MSMKSFDKFCEKIILGEPGSEKEIFDERQKQQRTQLTLFSLAVYAGASALVVMLNEVTPGFLEGSFSGMLLCAGAAYLIWVIMAARKGCLFGVSGSQVIINAISLLSMALCYTLMLLPDEDEESFAVIRNGKLTENAAVLFALAMMAVSAVIVIASNIIKKRSEPNDMKS